MSRRAVSDASTLHGSCNRVTVDFTDVQACVRCRWNAIGRAGVGE